MSEMPEEWASDVPITLAVYLLSHGANLNATNRAQLTCLDHIDNPRARDLLRQYFVLFSQQ